MGLTLKITDFVKVARDPAGLFLGLALQLLVVPALAIGAIAVLGLSPGWAVGLCLVAVVPGGAFSNLLTFLARGNVPLSISVTVTSTATCIITIPLVLGVIASGNLPANFELPVSRIVTEIGLYLIGPLILGMVVMRFLPRWSDALSKWCIRGAVALIVIITISALRSGRIKVFEYGWTPPLILLAFGFLITAVAAIACRAFRRFDDDTTALSIEVGVRNVGVALLLVSYFFPGQPEQGHVLYSCLFYAGASIYFVLPIIIAHRTGRSALPFRPRLVREAAPSTTRDPV